jgi:mono/diheme cytochrome c family protein
MRPPSATGALLLALLIAQPPSQSTLPAPAPTTVDFLRDIQPIFAKHCYRCHGETKQKSGYRLDVKSVALTGGDIGRAIVPGRSQESRLIQYVAGLNREMPMPPTGPRLSAEQISLLRGWIYQGAKWPEGASNASRGSDWWSLRVLQRPPVPQLTVAERARTRNPIDAFIIARLRDKGLAPAPEADRRTLIRRVTFDLIGLPPSYEQVEAFVADGRADAYERLVDRLLDSPQYGERWARHWLDVVHYGETHGYDKDKPRLHAWPYRDYVIRSFNADKPYGRFMQEQIAGDILFPDSSDAIEALGFIAAGPWDFIGHAEVPETKIDGQIARHLDRDDMVSNTMNTFTSLTVHCAQCHHHKFDPISQEDYYGLQAVFAALDRADKAYDVDRAVAKRRVLLMARQGELEQRRKTLRQQAQKLHGLEVALLNDIFDVPMKRKFAELRKEISDNQRDQARLPPPQFVYAGTVHYGSGAFKGTGPEGGRPRAIHILPRGDVKKPGKEVEPGALSAISGLSAQFQLPAGHSEGERRAALARWLVNQRNPLPWRSIVNRIWLYHFGRGIVDTPNDFGRMGQLPSHPELLDWLAVELRDGGQSLKYLHRLIVTSATYRQSSAVNPKSTVVDADNALCWRMNRRRLEAEAVRDSLLLAAGKLNLSLFGPSFQDFVIEKPEHSPHYEYQLHDPNDPKTQRRSIYRFIVRSQQQPFMTALDCADPSMLVDKRNQTITPLQALAMLNDQLTLVMARCLAERAARSGNDADTQVTQAFRIALSRSPGPEELASLAAYSKTYGLANACRVILNLNEFMFVD